MPADLNPNEVIQRYLQDERTSDIAASYGVKRSRLNQWLLEHAEEPWRKAQVARAITYWEQAKDDLEGAEDPLTLARAREQLRSAQWDLERLFSRLFGQKQEVSVTHTLVVEERLQSDLAKLLDVVRGQHVTQRVIEHNADSHDVTQSVTDLVPSSPQDMP